MKSKIILYLILLVPLYLIQSCEYNVQSGTIPQEKCVRSSTEKVDSIQWKKDIWQCIWFYSISKRIKEASMSPLKGWNLFKTHTEIRIWVTNLSTLNGFIFENRNSNWKAKWIQERFNSGEDEFEFQKIVEINPKSEWEALMRDLDSLEIFTLPDSVELPDDGLIIMDSTTYVVEINKDRKYRTYRYSNPGGHKWPEAEKMVKIIKRLRNEFDLNPDVF